MSVSTQKIFEAKETKETKETKEAKEKHEKQERHERQEKLETLAEAPLPDYILVADKPLIEGGKPELMKPENFAKLRRFNSMANTIKMPIQQTMKIKELMKRKYPEIEKEITDSGGKLLKMTSQELFKVSGQTERKLCYLNLKSAGYSVLSLEILNKIDLLCYGGVIRIRREEPFVETNEYMLDLPGMGVNMCVDGMEFRCMAAHLNHAFSEETLKEEFDIPNNDDPKITSMVRSTFVEDLVWLTDLEIFETVLRPAYDGVPAFTLQSFDYGIAHCKDNKLKPLYFDAYGREISGIDLKSKAFDLKIKMPGDESNYFAFIFHEVPWENFCKTFVDSGKNFVVASKWKEELFLFTPVSVQAIAKKKGEWFLEITADFMMSIEHLQKLPKLITVFCGEAFRSLIVSHHEQHGDPWIVNKSVEASNTIILRLPLNEKQIPDIKASLQKRNLLEYVEFVVHQNAAQNENQTYQMIIRQPAAFILATTYKNVLELLSKDNYPLGSEDFLDPKLAQEILAKKKEPVIFSTVTFSVNPGEVDKPFREQNKSVI